MGRSNNRKSCRKFNKRKSNSRKVVDDNSSVNENNECQMDVSDSTQSVISNFNKVTYPKNFDFGKYWKTKIVPHLDNPEIQKAIRDTIIFSDHYSGKTYPEYCPYSAHITPVWYWSVMDRRIEHLYQKYKDSDDFSEELKKAYDNLAKLSQSDNTNPDDIKRAQFELRNCAITTYFTWPKTKHYIETYIILHKSVCSLLALTFGLSLARLVEPDEKWRIRCGKEHATVINEDCTKVFDLTFWSKDGRLKNLLFGDEIYNDDPTLGGKDAYIFSTPVKN
jgi:hypothetical protein